MNSEKLIRFLAVIGLFLPLSSNAGPSECTKRPLSDFLDAQGTSTNFNNPGFFPPVPDMQGYGGGPPPGGEIVRFALIDYAGLANEYVKGATGKSLRTKVRGRVQQCTREDGNVEVTVRLFTRKALAFAQSIKELEDSGWDFLCTKPIFGARAQDVTGMDLSSCASGPTEIPAARGPATLYEKFVIDCRIHECDPEPALPDILDVAYGTVEGYDRIRGELHSLTFGRCADGARCLMRVEEVVAKNAEGELEWLSEIIDIIRLDLARGGDEDGDGGSEEDD